MPGSPTAPSTVDGVLTADDGLPADDEPRPDVDERPDSDVPVVDGTVISVGSVPVGDGAETVPVVPGTGTPCGWPATVDEQPAINTPAASNRPTGRRELPPRRMHRTVTRSRRPHGRFGPQHPDRCHGGFVTRGPCPAPPPRPSSKHDR